MLAYVLAATAQPESTVAGIIAAVAGVVTACAVLVGALTVFVPVLRSTRRVEQDVKVVKTIVNQQRTDAQRYNIALAEALRRAGVEIPVDQSLPVTGQPDAQPGQPHIPDEHESWKVEPERTMTETGPTTITLTGEMTEGKPE